ncbi:P22 phage major capsid protein family protein [Agromyces sp. NPDC056965]|uniref:P22 phage major capsid protein family protein n=1 Tax=Agromyces sp. NPDC056965 TaxID=3345983 RepID=UPI003633F58B
MTNDFLTADHVAPIAAGLVGADLGLAGLVYRDLEADFSAGQGDTVKVRVPGAVASQSRGIYDTSTPLVQGAITENSIDVKLTEHVYDSVPLSEGDLDLDIVDFGKQVLLPQTSAVVKHVERAVATAMSATPETTAITYAAASPAKAFTAIRTTLRDRGVPTEARLIAAVGSGVYGHLLDAEAIDENGKVRGFEIVESTRLASDEIVAFIPEAFALVVRAPQVPDGAPFGASVNEGGFALRWIRSYDATVAVDRSLVSAFVGVKAMPLAVDRENGTVELVANGGAVRVLTAA